MLFLIGLIIFWTLDQVNEVREKDLMIDTIVRNVNELRGLVFDYSLHNEERVVVQWRANLDRLKKLIASTDFEKPEQKEIISRISGNLNDMESAFSELVAIREKESPFDAEKVKYQQEDRLISLLLLKVQLIVLDSFKLSEASNVAMDLENQSLQIIIIFIMIFSIVTISVSILIIRSIFQPLSRLQEGTGIIGGGNLDHRVDIRSYDEINQLTDAFNQMTQKLKERTLHLESAIMELEDFAYSSSHDLRTPLRAVDGFSKALLEDYGNDMDGTEKDYLNRVRAAAQKMSDIIDAMLNLSLITRRDINLMSVDLSGMARKIADELKEGQPERNVEFLIEDGVTGMGDPGLLDILLSNLLGNAWKFTSKHPSARIEFGKTQIEGKTVYFVRDDGAGFDMTYVGKLFRPFERLHKEAEFPGTGIGLASVKRIIHRHKGTIWATGAEEKGATFYFTLEGGK